MKTLNLDAEESSVLESYERDEWRTVKNVKREIHRLQLHARGTLKKDIGSALTNQHPSGTS